MKGCSPAINEADRMRYLAFQDIGCICCVIEKRPQTPAQVHHITQDSNQNTLPLCPWHHQGQAPQGMDDDMATVFYGPSLAVSRRNFEARYGKEEELLVRVNALVQAIFKREVGHVAFS